MAPYPDMVFLDSRPLKQVASRAAVTAGSFYVDYSRYQLFIGDDPTGKLVEAAAYPIGLSILASPGTIVRGLGFMHYAPHYNPDQSGMVRVDSDGVTFENNTFAWSACVGLQLFGSAAGPPSVVRGNTFLYNGQAGLYAWKNVALLIEQNRLAYNNVEHFNPEWSGSGLKMAEVSGTLFRDNIVENNFGYGFWCDGSCYDTTVVRNLIRNQAGSGILYEISAKAIIASNVVVNNRDGGIAVEGSSEVDVYNNTLSNNAVQIAVVDDSRVNPDPYEISLGITWITANVTLKNNILSDGNGSGNAMLYAQDWNSVPLRTADQMVSDSDFNAYYRPSWAPAPLVEWWRSDTPVLYSTLGEFLGDAGKEANGLAILDASANPFFVDEANGDYHLRPGSPAVGRAQPLPPAIAGAIGASGPVTNLGAVIWPGY
jgi:parallel beta-helix repeat protein